MSLRPLKLTGQAQLCLGKRTGTGLAAIFVRGAAPPASPGRYLAKTATIADRVTERTESTQWTESVETYEAKRSALLLPKTGKVVLANRFARGGSLAIFACPFRGLQGSRLHWHWALQFESAHWLRLA